MAHPEMAQARATATQKAGAPLAKRRCDNCGKRMPASSQPSRRFCSNDCRYQFHKHTNAYGPLSTKIPKWIAQEVANQLAPFAAELTRLAAQMAAAGEFMAPDVMTTQQPAPPDRRRTRRRDP